MLLPTRSKDLIPIFNRVVESVYLLRGKDYVLGEQVVFEVEGKGSKHLDREVDKVLVEGVLDEGFCVLNPEVPGD